MDGIRFDTNAIAASTLLRDDTAASETSVKVLKKALQSEKNLVEALLPLPNAQRLDIKA